MPRPLAALPIALALLTSAPIAAAPTGGRAVRVERHVRRGLGNPRYCQFNSNVLTAGTCYGQAVEPGEVVTILSSAGVIARLRVTSVIVTDVTCGVPGAWAVEGELDDPPAPLPTTELLGGVVDGGLNPRRARAVMLDASPSGRLTDSEFYGFDADGDGAADVMFDHFMCDAQGQPSQSMAAQCYEAWSVSGRGRELRRVRLDIVPQC